MCCGILALLLVGPRIFGAFWWLFQSNLWWSVFRGWAGIWWIWPLLGLVFLPWATIMYVAVGFDGLNTFDWVLVGIALIFDLASYGGGAGRKQIPGYQGY
jgi:hypothetical protein